MKTDFKIGSYACPIDNSYSKCLSNNSIKPNLAGYQYQESKIVKIVSFPYLKKTNSSMLRFEYINEFIVVEYENELYEILNQFHDSYESMYIAKNKITFQDYFIHKI